LENPASLTNLEDNQGQMTGHTPGDIIRHLVAWNIEQEQRHKMGKTIRTRSEINSRLDSGFNRIPAMAVYIRPRLGGPFFTGVYLPQKSVLSPPIER
jgi:hypothetical protein